MARIVLVEDEPVLRALVARMLEDAGHEVQPYACAEDAWPACVRGDADLVVTDKDMPGMGGLELLRRLLAQRPDARVVMVSGGGASARATWTTEAARLGAVATLAKPFRPRELGAIVDASLAEVGAATVAPSAVA